MFSWRLFLFCCLEAQLAFKKVAVMKMWLTRLIVNPDEGLTGFYSNTTAHETQTASGPEAPLCPADNPVLEKDYRPKTHNNPPPPVHFFTSTETDSDILPWLQCFCCPLRCLGNEPVKSSPLQKPSEEWSLSVRLCEVTCPSSHRTGESALHCTALLIFSAV